MKLVDLKKSNYIKVVRILAESDKKLFSLFIVFCV